MLRNWRTGLYVFLCWLLFEDIVRKYMGNNMAIFFGKHVLVAVVYLAFYMKVRRNQEKVFRPPFLVPVLLFVHSYRSATIGSTRDARHAGKKPASAATMASRAAATRIATGSAKPKPNIILRTK
jgi:hypothetical protein